MLDYDTVDRENFALRIICGLNFCAKNISLLARFRNVVYIRILFFRMFNFYRSAYGRKYFNGENFPIYGSYLSLVPMLFNVLGVLG